MFSRSEIAWFYGGGQVGSVMGVGGVGGGGWGWGGGGGWVIKVSGLVNQKAVFEVDPGTYCTLTKYCLFA